MTDNILKEKFEKTISNLHKLESNEQHQFHPQLKEVKTLKNNANKTVSPVSKNFLLKQRAKKLKNLNYEILELLHKNEVSKYKREIDRLNVIFKNKELNEKDKEYLIKKIALTNHFDYEKFKEHAKVHLKSMGSEIMSDIDSLLSLK